MPVFIASSYFSGLREWGTCEGDFGIGDEDDVLIFLNHLILKFQLIYL